MKLLTCLTLYSIFYQPIITNRRITFYRFRAILKSFIKSAKFSGALYTPVMPRTNISIPMPDKNNNENYSARDGRFFAEFKSEFFTCKNARHEARFALFHIRFVQAVGERNRKRVHCKPRPEQGALREKQNVVFHLIVLTRVETENRPSKVD